MDKLEQLAHETEYYRKKDQILCGDFLISHPYMSKYDVQNYQYEMVIDRYQNTSINKLLKIQQKIQRKKSSKNHE